MGQARAALSGQQCLSKRWPPAHGPLGLSARDGPPAPLCESSCQHYTFTVHAHKFSLPPLHPLHPLHRLAGTWLGYCSQDRLTVLVSYVAHRPVAAGWPDTRSQSHARV